MTDKTVNTNEDSSAFFVDPFEGISNKFSNISELYAGKHTRLLRAQRYGRWYALKTLNGEAASQAPYMQVLRKELEMLMQIQHPGVVQAVGLEQMEDLGPCIVMEYIEGETLQQILDSDEGLTLQERRRIATELCEAVAYIHSLGIVHRDLKPENIMLTRNGRRVKLIDFGLADTDQHAVLKQPSGTLKYMAPEQASQSVPDIRNDIYSLGIILKQLNIGGVYKAVTDRCLKPINERYDSMEELQDDIRRRQVRRQRLWQLTMTAACLALIAFVVSGMLSSSTSSREQNAFIDSLQQQMTMEQKRNAARLTESRQEQAAMKEQMSNSMAMLGDSIKQLTAVNEQLQEELTRTSRAKAAALQALDQAIKRSQIDHHLDTLSLWAYRWPDMTNRVYDVSRFIYSYSDKLKTQMSKQETEQVCRAMLDHWQKWSSHVTERANAIRTKSKRDLPDALIIKHDIAPQDVRPKDVF